MRNLKKANQPAEYKYNGLSFVLLGIEYIVTATIKSKHPDTGAEYNAVIYKNKATNKMTCVSVEEIEKIFNNQ